MTEIVVKVINEFDINVEQMHNDSTHRCSWFCALFRSLLLGWPQMTHGSQNIKPRTPMPSYSSYLVNPVLAHVRYVSEKSLEELQEYHLTHSLIDKRDNLAKTRWEFSQRIGVSSANSIPLISATFCATSGR